MAKTWTESGGQGGLEPASGLEPPSDRYALLGALGEGGGGVVMRALDRHLGRVVALKRQPSGDAEVAARFEAEARAHAQLQHPKILAVHDLDRDAEGRLFFTLPEVRGRTLEAVIAAVHQRSGPEGWGSAEDGWGLARLVDALMQVAEAVASAHASGVLHRDLKPANIMIGPFGEVFVLDWGLARVVEGAAVDSGRVGVVTLHGAVSGTPAYMAPEQARGQPERVGPRTDVYGLGAVLYQILTGRPPFVGDDPMLVLLDVLAGPPIPPGYAGGDPELDALLDEPPPPGPPVPEELAQLCGRAMAWNVDLRLEGALAFADALRAWLDGADRRARALAHLEQAAHLDSLAGAAQAEADQAAASASELARTLPSWASEEDHAPVWALEDQATAAGLRAQRALREAEQQRQSAAREAHELPEVHAALAEAAARDLVDAESRADGEAALRAALRLQRHAEALPAALPARARGLDLLRGDGWLTLHTDPPGAEVWLERYEVQLRRLVPVDLGLLGHTPLVERRLPRGSYRLRLRLAGHHEVLYPVRLDRQGRWTGVPPGLDQPFPVPLPPLGALGPDEVYVPPGPFLAGGDPEQDPRRPVSLWCDGFVIGRRAIHFGLYLDFLNNLVSSGRAEEAERWEPRYFSPDPATSGAPVLERDEAGRYRLPYKPEHELAAGEINVSPGMPVLQIDHDSALAFARWRAARDGLPWRLPGELEREKAARGVDGRMYPMGDFLDPSWTWIRDSLGESFALREVDDLPLDLSPYEVMGLAGNVRCWCAEPAGGPPPLGERGRVPPPPDPERLPPGPRISRGGAWGTHIRASRTTFRVAETQGIRHSMCGVRLVRSYGPPAPEAPSGEPDAGEPDAGEPNV